MLTHKKVWKRILCIMIMLFSGLYLSGLLSQIMANYSKWQAAGGYPGDGTFPAVPSAAPLNCIKALTDIPYGLYGIFLCILILAVLFIWIRLSSSGNSGDYDGERQILYSDKGTYGTAGFMTKTESKKVLDFVSDVRRSRGTILGTLDGRIALVPENSRMNKNIAVYGASGTMKSRAFARNMIFCCVARGESLVMTDPKSELYESMSEYLRKNGYTVRAFNLVNPKHSDSWNCLAEIEGQELMAQLFSDVVIKNTGSERADHFWDNNELNLLKALVLYVEQGYPPEGRNIGQVYQLIIGSTEKELNALFDVLPLSHPAKAPYHIFKQASDTVRSGIIIGLGTRLQVFQNQMIQLITSHNEIDLTLPGKEKCAYFCITSDQDSTFDFLSSLFLSFLFIKLVRYADYQGDNGALPVPVHILADELANIGVIPDLAKKISTIRSRGISMSVIFQNLAQMQNRYPNNQWQEIIGNCDVQLFLGCTDEITAKFISDRTGEVTIGVSSESKQRRTMQLSQYTPEYRQTSSVGRRKLLTPDEVLRMKPDEALVILRGQKVLRLEKYDYMNHPEAKDLVVYKASDHIPEWRKRDAMGAAARTESNADNRKIANKKQAVKKGPAQKASNSTKQQIAEGEKTKIIEVDKNSIMS